MFEGFVKCFIALGFFLVIVLPPIATYMQAESQAKVINEQYGKHYTTWDMMMSGDVIKDNIIGKKRTNDITLKG